MQTKLIEIPFEKWPQLRNLYQHNKNRAISYNTIQTFIDWAKKDPNLPLKIYTPSREWEVDGTYVAAAPMIKQIFCNTLKDDYNILLTALNCFDNSHMVGGTPEHLMPAVEQHFLDSGLTKDQIMPTGTCWHHITREEALKFDTDLPENITTKGLSECHAEQVNRVWPHRSEGSVKFVKHLIKYNKSVGLFDGDKLVAWCLLLPLGSLGLLQVEESHRRIGLGKLAVKLMSKYLAENGVDITASVVFANVPSRSMFKQLGFTIIDNVYWTSKK
uniref:N-acetyltransferase domain-containing protein n=1 Tax=Stomoxys calcitrans TaxID=35570 RepID=A0A1I8P9K5_STOCA